MVWWIREGGLCTVPPAIIMGDVRCYWVQGTIGGPSRVSPRPLLSRKTLACHRKSHEPSRGRQEMRIATRTIVRSFSISKLEGLHFMPVCLQVVVKVQLAGQEKLAEAAVGIRGVSFWLQRSPQPRYHGTTGESEACASF